MSAPKGDPFQQVQPFASQEHEALAAGEKGINAQPAQHENTQTDCD